MTPAEGTAYLQTLPADELVFIVRAQDCYAPAAVQTWGAMCLSASSLDPKKHAAQAKTRLKGERAIELARRMRERQKQHGSKLPD